jgi:hypothetical protein
LVLDGTCGFNRLVDRAAMARNCFHAVADFIARFDGALVPRRHSALDSISKYNRAIRLVQRVDAVTGGILVPLPDVSNDNIDEHAHDRRNDQRHQELARGCVPFNYEQRKPVLRGYWSDVRYWHLADMS